MRLTDEAKALLRGLAAAYAEESAKYQRDADACLADPTKNWPLAKPLVDAWSDYCAAVDAL